MVKHMLAGGWSIYDAINQLLQDLNKLNYYNLLRDAVKKKTGLFSDIDQKGG